MYCQSTLGRNIRLFATVFVLLVVNACGGSPKAEDRIVGKWVANLGPVSGLGDISESMEFFKEGTVTSRSQITNFVGDYKFIDDSTLRIEWKEQGVFGNTPTQILHILFEGETLIITNNTTRKSTKYQHPDTMLKTQVALTLVVPDLIIGKWRYAQLTNYGDLEFNKDGTINAESNVQPDHGTTATGTYTIQNKGNAVILNIDFPSTGVWPIWESSSYRVISISKEKLLLTGPDPQNLFDFNFNRQ